MSCFPSISRPIVTLAQNSDAVVGTAASERTLHYCSPVHGGWGVIRTALLVPEIYLLFVCPAACGRHGAIAAIEQGLKHRVGYLCLEEDELVLGTYEPEIPKAIDAVLGRLSPKPRGLIVCVSCIDELLGTDHETMLAEAENRHGIPVRLAKMNPICLDTPLPPGLRIQKTMYEFLTPQKKKDRGLVLAGAFVPPAADSELARFVASCSFGPLRHPALSKDFDGFLELAQSSAVLQLRPEGAAAAEYLAVAHGMAVFALPPVFVEQRILSAYRALAVFLESVSGAILPHSHDLSCFDGIRAVLDNEKQKTAKLLSGKHVALDATSTASPFDLALALLRSGIQVTHVFVEKIAPHDKDSFSELAAEHPTVIVSNPSHHHAFKAYSASPLADVAIGFTAAYASGASCVVPLAFDEGRFGFSGFISVLIAIQSALLEGARDLQSQVADYGLVI